LLFFALFNGSEIAYAGVVNENIDATKPVLGRLDGGIDLVVLGNI
jgi:hypothetical protein